MTANGKDSQAMEQCQPLLTYHSAIRGHNRRCLNICILHAPRPSRVALPSHAAHTNVDGVQRLAVCVGRRRIWAGLFIGETALSRARSFGRETHTQIAAKQAEKAEAVQGLT